MKNKILHFVQNDNLQPPVLASLFCEAISIHKPKADCNVATLLAKTENDLGEVKPRLTGCLSKIPASKRHVDQVGRVSFVVKRSKTNTLFSILSVSRQDPASPR